MRFFDRRMPPGPCLSRRVGVMHSRVSGLSVGLDHDRLAQIPGFGVENQDFLVASDNGIPALPEGDRLGLGSGGQDDAIRQGGPLRGQVG